MNMELSLSAEARAQLEAIYAAASSTRADSRPRTPRLEEKVLTCPVTGRKFKEFSGDKAAWMDQFKSKRFLQLRICAHEKGQSEADQQRFEKQWIETNNMLLTAERRGR
jgi:hypothetical protein